MPRKRSINVLTERSVHKRGFKAIVIGTSAGGLNALSHLLKAMPKKFNIPIIVVQHLSPQSDGAMVRILNGITSLKVKEADEKEPILGGTVYLAPANYHLLVEQDGTFSLTIDPKINFCRPAVDLLFETAADVYRESLIGILLTGANSDGAVGLKKIKKCGGITIVEDPDTAEVPIMPISAIEAFKVDYILPLDKIYLKISELCDG